MIGAKPAPPIPPSDVMVMQPPDMALIGSPLSRACALRAASSAESVATSFRSASRRTGTRSPSGPSTAMPIWQYFLSTSVLPSSDSDALKRSEEHTSELQSLMRISYAVFCLKNKSTHLGQYNSRQKRI